MNIIGCDKDCHFVNIFALGCRFNFLYQRFKHVEGVRGRNDIIVSVFCDCFAHAYCPLITRRSYEFLVSVKVVKLVGKVN
uniref:Uncharacterized protein n=1 Tax=Anguilla anguilla TaxID=7936 RepID=A0A0E9WPS1_ANGAN